MQGGYRRSVGTQGVISYRQPLSIWYIYIPSEVDRDQYVQNCIRTNTVSLINENSEIINKVKIGKDSLQKIKYPVDQDSLGSPVICGNIASKNQLVVLSVFDFQNDFDDLKENESALVEKTETGIAEVRAQGDSGVVIVNVDTEQSNGGKVIINVSNSESAGELLFNINGSTILNSSGNIDINTDKKITVTSNEGVDDLRTTKVCVDQNEFNLSFDDGEGKETLIKYKPTEGFSYLDEYENEITINESNILINGKNAVNIGGGGEALVLGNTLAKLLKNLITEISAAATVVGAGGGGGVLLNAVAIAAYANQVDGILSQYSTSK